MSEPWSISGDFNAIRNEDERIGGGDLDPYERREFNDLLHACDLMEMTTTGGTYTWKNGTVFSRIDRSLINHAWFSSMDTTAHLFPESSSDHHPIYYHFQLSGG